MRSRMGAVVFWLVPMLLLGFAAAIRILSPSLVAGWKAHGLQQAPLAWQIGIDLSDMTIHLWYIWLPIYLACGITLRSPAIRHRQ